VRGGQRVDRTTAESRAGVTHGTGQAILSPMVPSRWPDEQGRPLPTYPCPTR
jgi:hypothetical protein